ncbi:hypothetical protein ACLOJK_014330 [Asimina triloba]
MAADGAIGVECLRRPPCAAVGQIVAYPVAAWFGDLKMPSLMELSSELVDFVRLDGMPLPLVVDAAVVIDGEDGAFEKDGGDDFAIGDAWICPIGISHKNQCLMMLSPDLKMSIDAAVVVDDERDEFSLPLPKKEVPEMDLTSSRYRRRAGRCGSFDRVLLGGGFVEDEGDATATVGTVRVTSMLAGTRRIWKGSLSSSFCRVPIIGLSLLGKVVERQPSLVEPMEHRTLVLR